MIDNIKHNTIENSQTKILQIMWAVVGGVWYEAKAMKGLRLSFRRTRIVTKTLSIILYMYINCCATFRYEDSTRSEIAETR